MDKIRIVCNVTKQDFTIGYRSTKVGGNIDHDLFSAYIAREIARLVSLAIDDQRFSSKWKPLSSSYVRYKKRKGLSTKTWKATGKLQASIGYDINDKVIQVGVDEYGRYPNGLPILKVAVWMEFGTKKMPERPLFRPIINYVRSNISYFYNKYEKEMTNFKRMNKKLADNLNWTHKEIEKMLKETSGMTKVRGKWRIEKK